MVPGPPAAPGGARDRLRAQGHRLGISCDDRPGGGAPGARESAARGRDLSGANPALHSARLLGVPNVSPTTHTDLFTKIQSRRVIPIESLTN